MSLVETIKSQNTGVLVALGVVAAVVGLVVLVVLTVVLSAVIGAFVLDVGESSSGGREEGPMATVDTTVDPGGAVTIELVTVERLDDVSVDCTGYGEYEAWDGPVEAGTRHTCDDLSGTEGTVVVYGEHEGTEMVIGDRSYDFR